MQFPALAACAKVLTPTGHSLTGAALGLLLVFRTNSLLYCAALLRCFTLLYSALLCCQVFRTNSAYARVYDARCIWGQLTNTIREMSRLAHTNMQVCAHARMLAYAGVCRLMYADMQVCAHARMLAYAGVCWRMPSHVC
jgi:predicted membrane chloride channel (bestrophin family)